MAELSLKFAILIGAALGLAGCLNTQVMPLAPNVVRVDTQAGGWLYAGKAVPATMVAAARETLARGYSHFSSASRTWGKGAKSSAPRPWGAPAGRRPQSTAPTSRIPQRPSPCSTPTSPAPRTHSMQRRCWHSMGHRRAEAAHRRTVGATPTVKFWITSLF